MAIRYTDDLCNGGVASASGETGVNIAAHAFDGLHPRWAHDGGAFPKWIKYDFGDGVSQKIEKIVLTRFYNQVKDFKVQGSNDNINWDDVSTEQCANTDGDYETVTFTFTNNYGKHRYVRIYITSTWDGGYPNNTSLWEVEMMAKIPSGFMIFL